MGLKTEKKINVIDVETKTIHKAIDIVTPENMVMINHWNIFLAETLKNCKTAYLFMKNLKVENVIQPT